METVLESGDGGKLVELNTSGRRGEKRFIFMNWLIVAFDFYRIFSRKVHSFCVFVPGQERGRLVADFLYVIQLFC